VFTGDTLYRDSVGLVNFPGEDRVMLRKSLEVLWDTLPPSSVICPGHGGAGTLESIKVNNVELIRFLQGTQEMDGL
jgi:glyoxylase-like metal-dependent hydrolase (beta-lactamase superfamily II)